MLPTACCTGRPAGDSLVLAVRPAAAGGRQADARFPLTARRIRPELRASVPWVMAGPDEGSTSMEGIQRGSAGRPGLDATATAALAAPRAASDEHFGPSYGHNDVR